LPVLARKLGLPVAAGWAAAFLGACFPTDWRVEATGRHESVPAALALLCLLWCLADLRQRGWTGRWPILRTGCLLGLTALLSPILLLVPVLFFVVELGGFRKRNGPPNPGVRCATPGWDIKPLRGRKTTAPLSLPRRGYVSQPGVAQRTPGSGGRNSLFP